MKPAPGLETKTETAPDRSIACLECGHRITHRRFARSEKEGHEHTFRNPAGYSYHVRCYAEAAGCKSLGSPTRQDSWFPEHSWSLALCAKCEQHLGWYFTGQTSFWGLIATRVTVGDTTTSA